MPEETATNPVLMESVTLDFKGAQHQINTNIFINSLLNFTALVEEINKEFWGRYKGGCNTGETGGEEGR